MVCLCNASSEFVSSSIPSWQILTAHAEPFRRARDLAFCLKVPLDSLLVWASNGGSGETARMRRLAWTFAARIGDKYQIRLTRPICADLILARGQCSIYRKRKKAIHKMQIKCTSLKTSVLLYKSGVRRGLNYIGLWTWWFCLKAFYDFSIGSQQKKIRLDDPLEIAPHQFI